MSKKTTTMSVNGAAEILGVHTNTIRNWINSGRLRGVQVGAHTLPIAAEVMRMVPDQPEMDMDAIADQLEPIAASFEKRATVLREIIARLRAGDEEL